jgi:heme A synthase
VSDLHRYVAYSIPAGFIVLMLWTIWSLIRNRPPHEWFWNLLAGLQVVLVLQAVIGVILFATGARPDAHGVRQWLHYAYGALFPLLVLVYAHRAAKGERFREIPWVPFGIASFFIFGLTFQAIRTGLGIEL